MSKLTDKTCDICHWCNTDLLNVSLKFGEPKMLCHGCISNKLAKITTLETALAEARKDVEILDWLEFPNNQLNMFGGHFVMGGSNKSLRVAVRAAMSKKEDGV